MSRRHLNILKIEGTINKTIEINKMTTYSNVEGFIPSWIHIIVNDLSLCNSHSKNIIINCRRISVKVGDLNPCKGGGVEGPCMTKKKNLLWLSSFDVARRE